METSIEFRAHDPCHSDAGRLSIGTRFSSKATSFVTRRCPVTRVLEPESAFIRYVPRPHVGNNDSPSNFGAGHHSTVRKRMLPAMKKTTAKATSIAQHSKTIRGSGTALVNSSS